jgi:SnoaL-like domain
VTTRTPSETTAALTGALVARDRETLGGLLAGDVRFFSPAYADPVVGRDVVTEVLAAASGVYSDLRFDEPRANGAEAVTFFTATVPGPEDAAPVTVEGCYRVVVTADGLVRDLTAYFRPLAGLQALVAGVMAARSAGS